MRCLVRQRAFLSSFNHLLLGFLLISLLGKPFTSGKCCSDDETVYLGHPCLVRNSHFGRPPVWLAWEGGDSNRFHVCE